MNDTTVKILAVIVVLFFGLMRWAHRSWVKAALSTLFAPLVAVPLAGASYIGVGILFKFLNPFLSGFDGAIPVSVVEIIAYTVAAVIMLWLTIVYCKDQRHLSLIETGPGLGVITRDSRPSLNAKCSLK